MNMEYGYKLGTLYLPYLVRKNFYVIRYSLIDNDNYRQQFLKIMMGKQYLRKKDKNKRQMVFTLGNILNLN